MNVKYKNVLLLLNFFFFTIQSMEHITKSQKHFVMECQNLTKKQIIEQIEQGALGKDIQQKLLFIKNLQFQPLHNIVGCIVYPNTISSIRTTLSESNIKFTIFHKK